MKPVALVLLLGAAAAVAGPGAADPDWRQPPAKDFPLVGGNWANQRYSALDQIDASNVSRLGAAWTIHLEDGNGGNMQATPIVVDGVLYVTTSLQHVFAIDAKTGAIRWTYAPELRVAGGGTNRGVAVGEGRVFFARRDNTLVALDRQNGSVAWTAQLTDQPRAFTSAAPIYCDGLVYIGIAGGEVGVRGQIGAYDAKTGREVWTFFTIPAPGERGGDTWEGQSYVHGGGPVWLNPAVDPELGTIYVPVGNAGPDNDGQDRGGDNLFTASILALDMKTGAYKWHFQEVHHDVWDYDASSAPILADVSYRGQPRKIVIHAGKTGFLYILDRVTGTPLIGIPEKAVRVEPKMKTAATQPFPIGDSFVPTCPEPDTVAPGVERGCIFTPYWDKPVVLAPGTQGGNAWAPSTFSPKTRLVYVPGAVINSSHSVRRQVWNAEKQQFETVGSGVGFYRPAGEPRSGTLSAIDPTTNRIVWQKRTKFPIGTGSGLLSTAGGLLFHGESDGNLVAYDVRDGRTLWTFQTGAGADAPVSTFQVDGEQYVAVLSGGNPFQLSARGDRLWAFRLGGTVPPAPAPPEPPLTQPAAGRPAPQSASASSGAVFVAFYWRAKPGQLGAYNQYIRTVAEPIDEDARRAGVFEEVRTVTPAPGTTVDWTHLRIFRLESAAAAEALSAGLDAATLRVVPDEAQRKANSERAAALRDLVRREVWSELK
jgi:PQQ-dependent dehydrogenase (methanol/ethanol family)